MTNYQLTQKAVEDLTDIWNYSCEFWSENQADKYYSLLVDSFEDIKLNPFHGKDYSEIEESLLGYLVGKHIVFYQINAAKTIVIIRILHQQMDIKNRIHEG